MNKTFSIVRRRVLGAMAAGTTAILAGPLRAAPRPVVVLTAYPDEVVSRFEAAFEKAHPEYRLQIVWRMPHEALPYLRQPQQSGVDVYWSASPRTYATLAKEGALRKLDIARTGLPDRIGSASLADPNGYYVATEMAGYGLALNPRVLKEQQLPTPGDWTDLADPRFAGQIALPSPAKVGYAPALVEILLQAYGWEKGWALWSEIAGNSALLERGSSFVTDEVTSGRRAVGLTIDFFAAAANANGAPFQFIYPPHNGINPGHIAVTAGSANPEGAKALVEFILSAAGQKILAHPDIRKLPVRPAVYGELPAGQFDPFSIAAKGGFAYDGEAARPRMGLTTALFEQFLAAPHDELVALWARVHGAESAGKSAQSVRSLLSTPPISESAAIDENLRRAFRERQEGQSVSSATAVENDWRASCERSRQEAKSELDKLGA